MSDTSAIRSALGGFVEKQGQGDNAALRDALGDVYHAALDNIYNTPYPDNTPVIPPKTPTTPTTPTTTPAQVVSPQTAAARPVASPPSTSNWFQDIVNGIGNNITQATQGLASPDMPVDLPAPVETVGGALLGIGQSALQGLGAVTGRLNETVAGVLNPLDEALTKAEYHGELPQNYMPLTEQVAYTAGQYNERVANPLAGYGGQALQGIANTLFDPNARTDRGEQLPYTTPTTPTQATADAAVQKIQTGDYAGALNNALVAFKDYGNEQYAELNPVTALAAALIFDPLNFIPGMGIGEAQKLGKLAELGKGVEYIDDAGKLLPGGLFGKIGTPVAKVTEAVKSGFQNVLLKTAHIDDAGEYFQRLHAFEVAGKDKNAFDAVLKTYTDLSTIPAQRASKLMQGFGDELAKVETAYQTVAQGGDVSKLPKVYQEIAAGIQKGTHTTDDLLNVVKGDLRDKLQAHMTAQAPKTFPIKTPNRATDIGTRFMNNLKAAEALAYIGLSPVTWVKNGINGASTMALEGVNPLFNAEKEIARLVKMGQPERAKIMREALNMQKSMTGMGGRVRQAYGQGAMATSQTGAFGSFMSKMISGKKIGAPLRWYEAMENGMRQRVWTQTHYKTILNHWTAGKGFPTVDAATKAVLHQYGIDHTIIERVVENTGPTPSHIMKNLSDLMDGKTAVPLDLEKIAAEMGIGKQDLVKLLDEHDVAHVQELAQEIAARVAQGEEQVTVADDVIARAASEYANETAARTGQAVAGAGDELAELEARRGQLVSEWNTANNAKGLQARKNADALASEIEAVERRLDELNAQAPTPKPPPEAPAAPIPVQEAGTIPLPRELSAQYRDEWEAMTDAQREFAIGYQKAVAQDLGNPFPAGADTFTSGAGAGLEEIPAPRVPNTGRIDEIEGALSDLEKSKQQLKQDQMNPYRNYPKGQTPADTWRGKQPQDMTIDEYRHYKIDKEGFGAIPRDAREQRALMNELESIKSQSTAPTFGDVAKAASAKGVATVTDKGKPLNKFLLNVLNKHAAENGIEKFVSITDVQTRAEDALRILDAYVPSDAPKAMQDAADELRRIIDPEEIKRQEIEWLKQQQAPPPGADDMMRPPAPKPSAPQVPSAPANVGKAATKAPLTDIEAKVQAEYAKGKFGKSGGFTPTQENYIVEQLRAGEREIKVPGDGTVKANNEYQAEQLEKVMTGQKRISPLDMETYDSNIKKEADRYTIFFGSPKAAREQIAKRTQSFGTSASSQEDRFWKVLDKRLSEYEKKLPSGLQKKLTTKAEKEATRNVGNAPDASLRGVDPYAQHGGAQAEIQRLRNIANEDENATRILSRDEMVKAKARTQADIYEAILNLMQREDIQRFRAGSDAKNRVLGWARREVLGATHDMNQAATVAADWMDNAVMISRDGETVFDAALSVLSPFQFWRTRFALQSLRRVADKPARLAWYLKVKEAQDSVQDDPRFPKRLRGMVGLDAPFLPQWAGGKMYFDLEEQLTAIEQTFGLNNREDTVDDSDVAASIRALAERGAVSFDEAANAIANQQGALWEQTKMRLVELNSGQAGADAFTDMFRPHMPFDIAWKLKTGNAKDIGVLFPMTRIIRNATSGLPKGNFLNPDGTGLNIEQPLKQGLRALTGNQQIPDWDAWEMYRIDRALADMVGNGELDERDALLALIERRGDAYTLAQQRAAEQMRTQQFSVFGGQLFPAGEQAYYKASVLRNQIIDQTVAQLGGQSSNAALNFLRAGKATHPDEAEPQQEYDAMMAALTSGQSISKAIAIAQSHLDAHQKALSVPNTIYDPYPNAPQKNKEAVDGFRMVIAALQSRASGFNEKVFRTDFYKHTNLSTAAQRLLDSVPITLDPNIPSAVDNPTQESGRTMYGADGRPTGIRLGTVDFQLASHEAGHVWWRATNNDANQFMRAAQAASQDRNPNTLFVTNFLRDMLQRGYDAEEIFAVTTGISGGNTNTLPPILRPFYSKIFNAPPKMVPEDQQIDLRDLIMSGKYMTGNGEMIDVSTLSYGEKMDLIKANGLNKRGTPLGDFYTQHPEWGSRQDVFAEPEGRLKGFLTDEFWQRYHSLSKLDARVARDNPNVPDGLKEFIINPERDYANVSIEQMAQWVKYMRGYTPQSELTPKIGNIPQISFAPPEQASRYQNISDTQTNLFNMDALQPKLDTYGRLTPTEKRAYRGVNPDVDAYFKWYGAQMRSNPDIDRLIHPDREPFVSNYDPQALNTRLTNRIASNLDYMARRIGDTYARPGRGGSDARRNPMNPNAPAPAAPMRLSSKVQQALQQKKLNAGYYIPRDVYQELLSLFRIYGNGQTFNQWLAALLQGG